MVQSSLSFSSEEDGCSLKAEWEFHFAPFKVTQDRLGFWISCHWNLDYGFQLLAGFWIPLVSFAAVFSAVTQSVA